MSDLPQEKLKIAQRVRRLGFAAIVFVVVGVVVPFVTHLFAILISRRALKISRENSIPAEYERLSYFALWLGGAGIIYWIFRITTM